MHFNSIFEIRRLYAILMFFAICIFFIPGNSNAATQMNSPVPGSSLVSSTTNFVWTSDKIYFYLRVGTSKGNADIYDSKSYFTDKYRTVNNIPFLLKSTVFVRLYTWDSGWSYIDYSYVAGNTGSTISIEDSLKISNVGTGDNAAYLTLTVTKPKLQYGTVSAWSLEFSVPDHLKIDQIIPVEKDGDLWEQIRDKVIMEVADEVVDGFGFGSLFGVIDIYIDIINIYKKKNYVNKITFEGGVENYNSEMILVLKRKSTIPADGWNIFISGRYAQSSNSTWMNLGSKIIPISLAKNENK